MFIFFILSLLVLWHVNTYIFVRIPRYEPRFVKENRFVRAINEAFNLNIASMPRKKNRCVARHARNEPTLATAHRTIQSGDTCGGGGGAVWAGTPDPTIAAQLWLKSPPHAQIIRASRRMACGAGPVSSVCLSF